MPRILAVTLNPAVDISCDADRVQPTLKVRTRNQMHDPGGGGTNVARVIATLGGEPELAYLSGGATGVLYEELLVDQGITCHRFPIEGHLRIAFMVHENDTGFEYRFVPEGPEVSEAELAPLVEFVSAFDGDFLVLSGSLPRNAPEDIYARMARAVEKNGVKVVLDTSGEALRVTLEQANVFLVKPSIGELEKLVSRKLHEYDAQDAVADLISAGRVEHVAISMGRGGALLVNASRCMRAPTIHVPTKSAVGAGDSFVAGMTWWLAQGEPVEEAFLFGVAAGAAAALTPGTQLCRRADVFSLYDQIRRPVA